MQKSLRCAYGENESPRLMSRGSIVALLLGGMSKLRIYSEIASYSQSDDGLTVS